MSFLYPQFLFGLLALGIPVIIHLFNFRKTKKIYFSNTLFLKNLKETTTTKLKIKHWLILLARLLFVFFLVLTFAQPFLPVSDKEGAPNAEGQNQVYIYLDNSLSMSSELGSNLRGVDQGINYIEEIIGLYPRNTSYHLLTNEFGGSSRVPRTGAELSDRVAEIGLTGVARSFEEVVSKVENDQQTLTAQNTGRSDVYLISDFQKSTGGDLNAIRQDTSDQVYLVPVRSSYESNVFVDSVFLASPFMLADETNELTIVLRNDNSEATNDFLVRMLINDQQVANGSVNLPANDTAQITFGLNFPLEKTNRCQVVFEDYPVTFDNEFYFSLNLGDRIRILEITQGTTRQPSAIAKVYANQQVFDFQSFSISNLDYSLIDATDLLVLNEVGAGSNANLAVIPHIHDFLANGGHILYIPPANGDMAFLREVTGNKNLSGKVLVSADSTGNKQTALANLDMANPFFSNMFEGEASNFEMATARRLLDHNLRGEALLKYRTGDPYLLSLSRSYINTEATAANPVYVFSTPLRNEYTSLNRHAIFVPVMYRLASMSKSLNNKLYYYANESLITLETTNFANNQQQTEVANTNQRYLYKLYKGEQEVIPSQRVAGGKLFMEIPLDIIEPGFYNLVGIEEGSTRNTTEDTPLTSLAFNVEKEESLTARYSVDELQQAFSDTSNIRIFEAENAEDFSGLLRQQQADVSLWKYTLLLALFFLLTEILLIRFL